MAKKRLFEEEEWTLEFDSHDQRWRIVVRNSAGMVERFITCHPYPQTTQDDVRLMAASPNLYRELRASIAHLKILRGIWQVAKSPEDSPTFKDLRELIERSELALAKVKGK